jgi:polyhydroxyalkanoate synthesis regulator phasin
MAQNDIFKRYLDAGMAFTQVSRERSEEFVKELVKQGDIRRKEAEDVIETLVERSRKNTEDLVAIIRQEVADQLRNIGLEDLVKRAGLPDRGNVAEAAEKADIAAGQAAGLVEPKKSGGKKPAAKKSSAKKATGPSAVPSPDSPLVVPGAPKKAAAKKLVVPSGAATAKKAGAKKATPAKKSTKKS